MNSGRAAFVLLIRHKLYLIVNKCLNGPLDEHKSALGTSYFAEFVAGLNDRVDIKDAAVLTRALRML
jgi:hypothetical protein